jgi:hypothetical protein
VLDNQGTLDLFPLTTGTLTVTKNFTSSGTIQANIGGTVAFTKLAIGAATATVSGSLTLALVNGFTPTSGQTFAFLTSGGARTGTFSPTSIPPGTSLQYNPNSVVLTVP